MDDSQKIMLSKRNHTQKDCDGWFPLGGDLCIMDWRKLEVNKKGGDRKGRESFQPDGTVLEEAGYSQRVKKSWMWLNVERAETWRWMEAWDAVFCRCVKNTWHPWMVLMGRLEYQIVTRETPPWLQYQQRRKWHQDESENPFRRLCSGPSER